jgi:hypothetical protein
MSARTTSHRARCRRFQFKVTNCDLKDRAWAASEVLTLRLYRAGRGNALQRIAKTSLWMVCDGGT